MTLQYGMLNIISLPTEGAVPFSVLLQFIELAQYTLNECPILQQLHTFVQMFVSCGLYVEVPPGENRSLFNWDCVIT